jgi:hypothetical protein
MGAFWGLMAGLAIGIVRFIWENVYHQVPCGFEDADPRPSIIKDVHYLHFGILLFFIVLGVTVVVSLLTEPIPDEYLVRLIFWNRYSDQERIDISVREEKAAANSKRSRTAPDGAGGGDGISGQVNASFDDDRIHATKIDVTDVENNVTESTAEAGATVVKTENKKRRIPWWRVAVNWLCGIEEQPPRPQLTAEQLKEFERLQTSLDEVPLNRLVCNINAVLLLTIATFFWGFFA